MLLVKNMNTIYNKGKKFVIKEDINNHSIHLHGILYVTHYFWFFHLCYLS